MSRRRNSPEEEEEDENYYDEEEELERRQFFENRPIYPNLDRPPEFEFLTPESYRLEQERVQRQQLNPPRRVDAMHVHTVFDSIKENTAEIMETLGGPHPDLYMFQIGPEELVLGFHGNFVRILEKHYTSPMLEIQLDKLLQITNKLELVQDEILHDELISCIFTGIQFVLRQPDIFQKYYADIFIEDTYNAYDPPIRVEGDRTPPPPISCPKGIAERMLFSVADACLFYCTAWKKKLKQKKNRTKKKKSKTLVVGGGKEKDISQFKRCANPVYRKLIRLFKKEVPDLNLLTSEWGLIFEDTELMEIMTPDDLKNHFIRFMTNKYKAYGITQTDKIMARANQFEQLKVFERKAFL